MAHDTYRFTHPALQRKPGGYVVEGTMTRSEGTMTRSLDGRLVGENREFTARVPTVSDTVVRSALNALKVKEGAWVVIQYEVARTSKRK